jgi:hypothetical protein
MLLIEKIRRIIDQHNLRMRQCDFSRSIGRTLVRNNDDIGPDVRASQKGLKNPSLILHGREANHHWETPFVANRRGALGSTSLRCPKCPLGSAEDYSVNGLDPLHE